MNQIRQLSEVVKINAIKFNDYISFVQGTKSANNELFKDFCNEAQLAYLQAGWNRNGEIGGIYFDIFTKALVVAYC